jgi:hypothetical protein
VLRNPPCGDLGLVWNRDRHQVQAQAGRESGDTDAALRADIDRRPAFLLYTYQSAASVLSAKGETVAMGDGNRLGFQSLQFGFRPPGREAWAFGLAGQHADSRRLSSLYYTPSKYWAGGPQVSFQKTEADGSTASARLMVGRSGDAAAGAHWYSLGSLQWTRLWTPHFRTLLDLELNAETGYRSRQGGLTLQWRF